MEPLKRTMVVFFCLLILLGTVPPGIVVAKVSWDFQPPQPDDDMLWNEVGALWQAHHRGDKFDDIVNKLLVLEKKYPSRIEPLLWLGKIYLVKGAWNSDKKNKEENLAKAINYALSAHKIDSENLTAFRILASCLPNLGNLEYAMNQYGQWIEKAKPLPTGRALPELSKGNDWQKAIEAWDNRDDIGEAKKAVTLFQKMADDDQQNGEAQIWTCRGMYYLGYYYMAEQEEETSKSYFGEGVRYGERALKVLPDSVPANYWYALNFGRTIQDMSIFKKAVKFKPLLDHTIYCARENPLYFYFGPVLVMGTTITRGGWVVEKVMGRIGVNLEQVINGLEMAEALYPDYLYIPYCKAEIFSDIDRKEEAKAILEKIINRDVDLSPYHSAENRIVMKLTKLLLKKLDS